MTAHLYLSLDCANVGEEKFQFISVSLITSKHLDLVYHDKLFLALIVAKLKDILLEQL